MKKGIAVLCSLLLFTSLTACGGGNSVPHSDPASAGAADLTVYYTPGNPDVQAMVTRFQRDNPALTVEALAFEDAASLDSRLSDESEEGSGPDVVLFSDAAALDTQQMAAAGDFADLAPLLAGDASYSPEDYFPLLDAGRIGERQFFLPLRFRIHYLISSREKLESEGLSLPSPYSMPQLMERMEAAAENNPNDTSGLQILSQWTPGGLLYDVLRLSGILVLDWEGQRVDLSQKECLLYAAYARSCVEQVRKSEELLKPYQHDFIGAFSKLTFFMTKSQLAYTARQYDAIFAQGLEQEMCLLPYTSFDGSGIVGDVTLYAAILERSSHRELAYDFLRSAMDSPMSAADPLSGDFSVSRPQVSALLDALAAGNGKSMSIGAKRVLIPALSPQRREEIQAILDQVQSGSIRNAALEKILARSMQPYLEETGDFSACYAEMTQQLEAHLQDKP